MRRAIYASLGLVTLIAAVNSAGWAVERQLAGIRLGEKALTILKMDGYGQPAHIGPLGTVGVPAPEQRAGGAAAGPAGPTGPAGARAGQMGRGMGAQGRMGGGMMGRGMGGGMRGGMRGGMMGRGRAAAPSGSVEIALTGAMGGGMMGRGGGAMGGGMMGRGAGGAMGGGMMGRGGGGAMRGGMMGRGGGGAMRGGMMGRGAGGQAAAPRGGAAGGGGMFWRYRRPGGAVLVLGFNPAGEVIAITLSGAQPYPAGLTSRSIGLTSRYMDVIARYGYPDETLTSGNAVQLTYVDHGVRFTLEGMRVNRIAIGADIVGAVEAAPAAEPQAAPPEAGMSIEELRGYL